MKVAFINFIDLCTVACMCQMHTEKVIKTSFIDLHKIIRKDDQVKLFLFIHRSHLGVI